MKPAFSNSLLAISITMFYTSAIYCQIHFINASEEILGEWKGDSRSVHLVDINGDGLEDIFITRGPKNGAVDLMLLQEESGHFTRLTLPFDSITLPSVGACVADFTNNGLRDIFTTSWYGKANIIYQQESRNQFLVTPISVKTFGEAVDATDINQDGWLDLFASNSGGNMKNILYMNTGKKQFMEIESSNLTMDFNPSRGVSWIDYNNDGLVDLFVCNENDVPNLLYLNKGLGIFEKITEAGDLMDKNYGTMSASWGDINNDGLPDLFLANAGYFKEQPNQLFINEGEGRFSVMNGPWEDDGGCSYSSSFADFDNDGDLDLIVTNGYCQGETKNFLYLNDGKGNFTRDYSSIKDLDTPCSYGVAWGDITQNGFPDLVIATCQSVSGSEIQSNQVWLNQGNENNWIKFSLTGTISNRDAIGAQIRIKSIIDGNCVWQTRWIQTQSGYCSQNSLKVHFGIKNGVKVETVTILWPSGIVQTLHDLPCNKTYNILEESAAQTGSGLAPK